MPISSQKCAESGISNLSGLEYISEKKPKQTVWPGAEKLPSLN
jgi:hypothetical protein